MSKEELYGLVGFLVGLCVGFFLMAVIFGAGASDIINQDRAELCAAVSAIADNPKVDKFCEQL